MSETVKADFSFINFKITDFQLTELRKNHNEISIDINPIGTYSKSNRIFTEILEFLAFEGVNKDSVFIKVTLKANFEFEIGTEINDIPNYFYLNSIAIVFPYLRAFISNLTLQANQRPLILPVLNLTGLEYPLRNNTTEIE